MAGNELEPHVVPPETPSRTLTITTEESAEVLDGRIVVVRGRRVMLDGDLAVLYGVPLKRLNQQAKRNRVRFPHDFMFQLTWRRLECSSGQGHKLQP
jgi:hypothetical protein